jgi:hypothetical protein
MNVYRRTSLSEFLGDRVVYRKLAPADPQLPGLDELRMALGIPAGQTPRKIELDYARVIVAILYAARRLDAAAPIQRLVYLGDTQMLDGIAFQNICQVGGWQGLAFIASEAMNEPPRLVEQGDMVLSNRWAALDEFERLCLTRGIPIDAGTAVVIDLDKTAIGARGRNGQVIDNARVQAVEQTVAELLGANFDPQGFRRIYDHLNQPLYHPFTADNQDYLAYICLILASGMLDVETLVADVNAGHMASFEQFIALVETRSGELDPLLQPIHAEILANVRLGDPTPFKSFRANEYRNTIGRFGCLPDNTQVDALLSGEIVITEEVRQAALAWRGREASLFGLSDKPDEAALPGEELARTGYPALHRAITHAVGE